MISRRWKLYQISVDSVIFRGIQNPAFRPGIEQTLLGGDGFIDRTYSGAGQVRPDFEFDCLALAAALAKAPLNGYLAVPANPITITFAQMDAQGIASGSVHKVVTVNNGLIVPVSVRGSQGEDATVRYRINMTWDGTNLPYTVANNAALPAQTPNTEVFRIGQVDVNGSTLEAVNSIEVNFGTVVNVLGDSGSLYPTWSGIGDREGGIVIGTHDLNQLDGLGISGTAQGATDSVVYFRKRALDGGLVADATAEHVSITMDAGHIAPGDTSQQDNAQVMQVLVAPRHDGTNLPFVIDTATAIA